MAAKIEFSYGAVQTVNLLALRLQWFESTPTQASPRAILQVMTQLAPAGINIIIKPQNQTLLPVACSTVQHFSSAEAPGWQARAAVPLVGQGDFEAAPGRSERARCADVR